MYKYISNRLALSEKGTRDFVRGTLFTTVLNLTLMLPAVFAFLFLDDYLLATLDRTFRYRYGLAYYGIVGLLFLVITWLIARIQYKSTFTTIYEESARRRINLAEKLRKLPLAFFGEKDLSDLTSTIMSDSTELEHTFSHAVPQLCASVITILLMAAGLFFYQWQLALALFWVVPIGAAVIMLSKSFQKKGNQKIYDIKREVSDHIQEGLDTVQEIKSCRMEDEYILVLRNKLQKYESRLIHTELLTGLLVNGAQSILKLGLASVIIVGANLLSSGQIPLLTYLFFLIIASRIFDPINEVFNNLAALFYLDVRIRRMKEMESLPVQIGEKEFSPVQFDIEFNNVGFSYDEGKTVLKDVNFCARQGEITALVGPSGGGKSTSAKLAARFWDADEGSITLGGRNIRDIDPETLLQYYSVVFQDVTLFNTTVMDNIRIGNRDASDEQVMRVARLAQCDDFILKMPGGYQTVIGENGETLSGGERQRISIARALLKDAPIVLLDEATASLDVENETKVKAGISELIRNKTVLIIAHRMRTVAHADRIVVLKDGTVAETGSPDELNARRGIFASMLERQNTAV